MTFFTLNVGMRRNTGPPRHHQWNWNVKKVRVCVPVGLPKPKNRHCTEEAKMTTLFICAALGINGPEYTYFSRTSFIGIGYHLDDQVQSPLAWTSDQRETKPAPVSSFEGCSCRLGIRRGRPCRPWWCYPSFRVRCYKPEVSEQIPPRQPWLLVRWDCNQIQKFCLRLEGIAYS